MNPALHEKRKVKRYIHCRFPEFSVNFSVTSCHIWLSCISVIHNHTLCVLLSTQVGVNILLVVAKVNDTWRMCMGKESSLCRILIHSVTILETAFLTGQPIQQKTAGFFCGWLHLNSKGFSRWGLYGLLQILLTQKFPDIPLFYRC